MCRNMLNRFSRPVIPNSFIQKGPSLYLVLRQECWLSERRRCERLHGSLGSGDEPKPEYAFVENCHCLGMTWKDGRTAYITRPANAS